MNTILLETGLTYCDTECLNLISYNNQIPLTLQRKGKVNLINTFCFCMSHVTCHM